MLPQPKYTIPAEASQHWPQEDNYTLCRKSWWIPLRWLSQAVLSNSVEFFVMFCPAGTQDDCLVCCLATYSSFVLHFFFQSLTPLSFWFHLLDFMPYFHILKPLMSLILFSKIIPTPTSVMSFTNCVSVLCFHVCNKNTDWKWNRRAGPTWNVCLVLQQTRELLFEKHLFFVITHIT